MMGKGAGQEEEKSEKAGMEETGHLQRGRRERRSEHDKGGLPGGGGEEAVDVSKEDLREWKSGLLWTK